MRTMNIVYFFKVVLSCALLFAALPTQAKGYPDKSIDLIVPFSAGGSMDIIGRILGQKLAQEMKVSVIVENKTGFSGNIGAQYVSRAAPDGYTVLMASLTTYSLNAKLLGPKRMGYDLVHGLKMVAVVGKMPEVLVVNNKVPANNLPELIKYLKQNPGKDSFGSSGVGSIGHVAGELFKLRAGVNIFHVPFRGSAASLLDVMSGHVQMTFSTTPALMADLASGRLKAIAVAAPKRAAILPNVPTMAEQGLAGIDVTSLPGIMVPAGTPDAIVAKLNAGLEQALKDPKVKEKLSQQGIEVVLNNPKQATRMFQSEVTKWSQLIDETHISVQ
ncbi:MAG: tripartite tricarboxylate transporter substrate binding protein [Candidimonas sp.]|nr:MAG: tripartite tricarboxylate transporter substrate binding protein [Candidimonas sp.]TAM27048.1 MAG: tripartite tricarboxylate transporter substrate binding protein [Candidimonas sp.]